VWLYLNGNEWAKRQAIQRDIPFTPLDNGFAACEDSAALAEICSGLQAADVQAFSDRWQGTLPWPLTGRAATATSWPFARPRSPTRACSTAPRLAGRGLSAPCLIS
jgi:hypothetical protein